MKKVFCLLFFTVLLISSIVAEGQVSVIMKYKDESALNDSQVKEMSVSEFHNLEQNESLAVQTNARVRLFLTESSPLIQASETYLLESEDLNLTGNGESVCIIDTGISDNQDLSEKILREHCFCGNESDYDLPTGCCPNGLNEDSSATDDNGHGTHVAGIVAANGNLNGIAKGAGIVAVKVLDASGSGWDADVVRAIDWCVANQEEYNISVISLSLGGGLFSSACDSSQAAYGSSIDEAVSKNISVVVASGNDGDHGNIASPACIENAIAVGDTYDANILGTLTWGGGMCSDVNPRRDGIVCHSDRNVLIKLFAPGALINSTMILNNNLGCGANLYCQLGGTSMAAPHVAGAIAIINQYLASVGRTKTPEEIEQILFDTGKQINDSGKSNLNYSRISIYPAIISLDTDVPVIGMISPENNTFSLSSQQNFSCNFSDLSLKNATFSLWNSSGLVNETNLDISGSSYDLNLSISGLSFGDYIWKCSAYDEHENMAITENYTLNLGGIQTSLDYPKNNLYTNINETYFNCSAASETRYELSNITFFLWNSSELVYNETKQILEFENFSEFNFTLTDEGSYSWNCFSMNNNSNSSWAENNFTLVYDVTIPIIDLISISTTTTSANFLVNTNEPANLSISYGANFTNSNYSQNHSFSLVGLNAGTNYNYNLTMCDNAGNCNSSVGRFTTLSSEENRGGGGGGGGSGGGGMIAINNQPQVYVATQQQISSASGYRNQLKKGDTVKFIIFDEKAENHSITVVAVTNISANLILQSEPINMTLGIGQSRKFNLTSLDYYDLVIKLESIANNTAKLLMQTIHEPIIPERNVRAFNESTAQDEPELKISKKNNFSITLMVLSIVIALVLGFYVFDYFERRRIKKELLHEMKKKRKSI